MTAVPGPLSGDHLSSTVAVVVASALPGSAHPVMVLRRTTASVAPVMKMPRRMIGRRPINLKRKMGLLARGAFSRRPPLRRAFSHGD